jgi:hypothetical protein
VCATCAVYPNESRGPAVLLSANVVDGAHPEYDMRHSVKNALFFFRKSHGLILETLKSGRKPQVPVAAPPSDLRTSSPNLIRMHGEFRHKDKSLFQVSIPRFI